MDFKPEKYRKGELVRYFQLDDTLGIVIGQDGSKVWFNGYLGRVSMVTRSHAARCRCRCIR